MDRFKQLINKLGIYAQNQYPLEACGIITKDFDFIECNNISAKPTVSFIVDPIKLMTHEDNMWGIFHSHPGSEYPLPSEEDLQHTVFDEYFFVVGFVDKYFIYWYDKEKKALIYEPFTEEHCK